MVVQDTPTTAIITFQLRDDKATTIPSSFPIASYQSVDYAGGVRIYFIVRTLFLVPIPILCGRISKCGLRNRYSYLEWKRKLERQSSDYTVLQQKWPAIPPMIVCGCKLLGAPMRAPADFQTKHEGRTSYAMVRSLRKQFIHRQCAWRKQRQRRCRWGNVALLMVCVLA